MRKAVSLLLIMICSFVMMNFSSFTPLPFVLFLPGFLFGFSIIIPRIFPLVFSDFKVLLVNLFYYVVLWFFSVILYESLQILTYSINDKAPYIIAGAITGLAISFLFQTQFGFENKKEGFFSIIVLSILACLIFDYFYPNPHDKELYIGRQIFIWNIFVGIGLTINKTGTKTLKPI